MTCPTCDHLMEQQTVVKHWCPRCGTLAEPLSSTKLPLLIERLLRFPLNEYETDIQECINLEARKD